MIPPLRLFVASALLVASAAAAGLDPRPCPPKVGVPVDVGSCGAVSWEHLDAACVDDDGDGTYAIEVSAPVEGLVGYDVEVRERLLSGDWGPWIRTRAIRRCQTVCPGPDGRSLPGWRENGCLLEPRVRCLTVYAAPLADARPAIERPEAYELRVRAVFEDLSLGPPSNVVAMPECGEIWEYGVGSDPAP